MVLQDQRSTSDQEPEDAENWMGKGTRDRTSPMVSGRSQPCSALTIAHEELCQTNLQDSKEITLHGFKLQGYGSNTKLIE